MCEESIRNGHVMVVGCGALGNEVMKNLVLMGVGHIVIVDFDSVEMGNLTRSVLYRRRDIGRLKVDAARDALLDINPELDIETIDGDIAYNVGLGTIRRMDVVMGCVDSRWARYCIQRLCLRAGKTWIDGGILGLEGTMRVFRPGCNCYACSLGDEGLSELRRRMPCSGIIRRQEQAGHAPTTPIIASIIGAAMVQEAVKMLTGTAPEARQRKMLYYEGESMTVRTPIFEAWDDDCPLHDEWTLKDVDGNGTADWNVTAEELVRQTAGTMILNEPFVDYITDRRTDERTEVMLPAHRVEDFVVSNPKLSGRLLSDFYQHEILEVSAGSPLCRLTLRGLGIPDEDIVRFRTEHGYLYVPLTRAT